MIYLRRNIGKILIALKVRALLSAVESFFDVYRIDSEYFSKRSAFKAAWRAFKLEMRIM
jgi:hypothetical protein